MRNLMMMADQAPSPTRTPRRRSLVALDWFNFFMADVETGVGPFVSMYFAAAMHWNPEQIGLVLAAQNIASVAAQVPAGLVVDWCRDKRWILVITAAVISIGCLLIVAGTSIPVQMMNQVAIGMATVFVSPTVAAISLGMVGRGGFAQRVGRNGAFSHAGNVSTAALAGYLGYRAGQQWIFWICAALGAVSIAAALLISNRDIDYDLAREAGKGADPERKAVALAELTKNRLLLVFAAAVVMFHIANAAMLPLAGQEIAHQKGRAASLFMTGCIVVAQAVMVPVAAVAGRLANRIGRKPLFLAAFSILILRGLLFLTLHDTSQIVAIEALDGLGTGISGVLTIVVISDLARGTGRFNFLQGAIQACVSGGAFLGNLSFGHLAKAVSFPAAFGGLALTAAAGLVFFAWFFPETKTSDGNAPA